MLAYYFRPQRMLPIYYETEAPVTDQDTPAVGDVTDVDYSDEKAMPKSFDYGDSEEYRTKRKENVDNFSKVSNIFYLMSSLDKVNHEIFQRTEEDFSSRIHTQSV